MESVIGYNTLSEFVDETRAKGRYSFSWAELKECFNLSDKALTQALFRLKKKGRIAKIRKGFYAVITPEYSKQGMIPPYLFVDDLMKLLGKKYYVGLLSAAALYGAAHQQPMEYYVITEKPSLRNIKSTRLSINFYVKKNWLEDEVVQKKTDAGYMNVSTPSLTALDLLTYGNLGINRIYPILEELVEEIRPAELTRVSKNYTLNASVQRLGYIMDREIGNKKLADVLKKTLKDRKTYSIPLLKNSNDKGVLDNEWKIIRNIELERDL